MGRYYAMDRDNRWSREHRAYEAMVNCIGRKRADPLKALDEFYAKGETDEFIKPTLLLDKCIVDEHDTVFFFNFRSDRARELTRAFVLGRFQGFKRKKILGLNFVTLTQFDSLVKCPVAFKPIIPEHTLGEVLSQAGISQLRLAETEKWAHVTYFFNGLCECVFPHEHRIHIPSRKVSTYEKTPKMKVKEITDTLLKNQDKHDFFLVNFANADMVAHSGDKAATKAAVEAIDVQLGRIIRGFNGKIIVTADHGNAEDMVSCTTCHTTNRVPIATNFKVKSGALSDVAPTILGLFKIKPPTQMTGATLLHKRL
jgi:2,3-bisphosphoglycerate-independent phosphoglycerate mutase